jgi:hypothetical protein
MTGGAAVTAAYAAIGGAMNPSRLVLPFVLCGLAGTVPAQKHPHFDDKGALAWHTKLADAKAAAAKVDKLIFIEYGREA